jgi:zinc transporter ZupT
MSDVLVVFLYASITAVATGLGVLPFFFFREVSKVWLGRAGGLAAGIMAAASFNLIFEGLEHSMPRVVAGILIGTFLILLAQMRLSDREELDVGALSGADALKALLIVGVMTAHSFAEGVGVGVSFGGGQEFGAFISVAIAIHNIPEGLAISLVLIPKGVKPWKVVLWAIFTSVPQPLIAVPAFLFVEVFQPFLPIGLGLAAGAMVWMITSELIPDALKDTPKEQVATITTVGVAAMIAFQVLVGG